MRSNLNYTMTLLPLNWLKIRVSDKKVLWLLATFRWYVRACTWSSWTIPADIIVETLVKNCTTRFYNYHSIGMKSYLSKEQLQIQSTETLFCICLWNNNQVYLNFVTCLYFPLALIRWNSSHCHLMQLFKCKKSCKEKFDSNNNWKAAWPRMILE